MPYKCRKSGAAASEDCGFPKQKSQATFKEESMKRTYRIIRGDAKEVLASLPTDFVDLTVTSPPYFRHRDYGVHGQLGMERTVDDYLKNIRAVLVELLRVTSRNGACFFVVGDTYCKQRLLLVPHRIALAADEIGWIVRNDLIWRKLDPPPESPGNRWRCAHEHILFLTKQRGNYKFHADAIRVPYSEATVKRWANGQVYGGPKSEERKNIRDCRMRHGKTFKLNPNGCLPTDVWSLPAGDSSARHYATFPDRLVKPIILACTNVGDLVLDPFAGSGTTCRIAKETGRQFIGIELNSEYAKMAVGSKRIALCGSSG
jgi:site-specific DNA-methyltransferase (adenine-specific)